MVDRSHTRLYRTDELTQPGVGNLRPALLAGLVGVAAQVALTAPFMLRYGYKDSPQAVVFIDRDGLVRHVVQAGPNAELPSNAEILRRLDAIR